MFEIWDKQKISSLSQLEKEQWFDVYNYKLEEDRGILLSDPELKYKQKVIKDDYFKYIESCPKMDNFYKYYILKEQDKIVSICRINIENNKYILEGLQTHKDDYRKGYASTLIEHMLFSLYKDGIDIIYSEARVWNDASNNLQTKLGFNKYGQEGSNFLYHLDIKSYLINKKHLNIGLDVFGKAYGVMYRHDLHDHQSIDYQLLERMILINDQSKDILYDKRDHHLSSSINKHELFGFSQQFKGHTIPQTIDHVLLFTKNMVDAFDTSFESMMFGGTEKEIIVRGTDWCSDISRVGCAILLCLNIPSRIVMLADKDKAYHGHVVSEAMIDHQYITCDFTYGIRGNYNAYQLINDPTKVEDMYQIYKNDSKIMSYVKGLYSQAAISEYHITAKHQYHKTYANSYYKKMMTLSMDGTWQMNES